MLVSTLFTAINAVKINKHSEVALLELLLLYDPSCSFVGRSVGRSEFPKRAGTCSSILLSEHLFTFVKIKQSKRAGSCSSILLSELLITFVKIKQSKG